MFRAGLRRILTEHFPDAVIREACSCSDCFDLLRAEQFELCILDVSMQGKNSLAFLPDIVKLGRGMPILMLSMHGDRQFVFQALRLGASGYVTKEHTDQELIKAIETVLTGKRYVSASLADNLLDLVSAPSMALPHEALSCREREVFDLLAGGQSVSEISEHLSLSVKTISTYRTRILEKMGLGSNGELMRYALRHQLISEV